MFVIKRFVTARNKIAFGIGGVWIFLRVLTSLTAAAFSVLKSNTLMEERIAVWPPGQNLLLWLNRVFVAPWARYDAVWYVHILNRGYAAGDGSTSFHPLYVWLSYPLSQLGWEASVSLLMVSSLAGLAFLGIFYQLARMDHEHSIAWSALLLLATFPVAFILFAPYTESLFMLWATAALYSIRRDHRGLAALFCFLAALTRQQGLFLAIPLAWWAWEASGKSFRGIKKAWTAWLVPWAAPAGLVLWGLYRIGYLHEGGLDFSNLQSLIYSAFLSPSAHQVIAGQAFRWPWEAFFVAISKAIQSPDISVFINLGLGIGFLFLFIIAWRYLNAADRLYSLTIIVVSFSLTTGQYAYLSLPRHLLLAFPVFIGLAAALKKSHQMLILLACQTIGYIFLIYCYVLNGWVP